MLPQLPPLFEQAKQSGPWQFVHSVQQTNSVIPVLEKSNNQRYHYHTVIDRIDRLSRDQFESVVTDCWQRTLWGYGEIDFQYDISKGWLYYITKPSQKQTLSDATDWQNFHV